MLSCTVQAVLRKRCLDPLLYPVRNPRESQIKCGRTKDCFVANHIRSLRLLTRSGPKQRLAKAFLGPRESRCCVMLRTRSVHSGRQTGYLTSRNLACATKDYRVGLHWGIKTRARPRQVIRRHRTRPRLQCTHAHLCSGRLDVVLYICMRIHGSGL